MLYVELVLCIELVTIFLSGQTTHLKEDFYEVGALKKGLPADADFDEDFPAFLGIESLCEVTFFSSLQIRGATFHSRMYKRVVRRNNYTIAYGQG